MSSSRFGYKVLNEDGTPFHGGKGKWHLPSGDFPGEWMSPIEPIPCKQGYHYCRHTFDLFSWLGPVIYQVEVRGKIIEVVNKAVAEEARLIKSFDNWNERSARLFAVECAERSLKYIPTTQQAIFKNTLTVATRFAKGFATSTELAAARAAARDAAWAAARDPARDAAWDAARDAAWDAAWAAAWDVAWVAARDAAREAAWAAAWAPRDVAWTARDAAREAARAAARDAEIKWQTSRLQKLLES